MCIGAGQLTLVALCAGLAATAGAQNGIGFWQVTTVDSAGDVGAGCALAVLPTGFPAIAYADATNGALKFAWQDAVGWHTETAADPADTPFSLAVLASGEPAVVYNFGGEFQYAYRNASGWHSSATGVRGTNPSLVGLPSGAPAFSFYDPVLAPADLQYATLVGQNWRIQVIASFPQNTFYSDNLALTPTGEPAVAAARYDAMIPAGELMFSQQTGGAWSSPELAAFTSLHAYHSVSLAFRPGGNPVISYIRDFLEGYGVQFAERVAASWNVGLLYRGDLSHGWPAGSSIAVFPAGEPALIYQVGAPGPDALWFADRWTGTWRFQPAVAGQFGAPRERALGVLPSGQPAISLYNQSVRDLQYALGFYYGDLNCDASIDFYDINPFVLALTDPGGYAAQFPDCSFMLADVNADGAVNFDDINPFVALLTGTP